MIMGLVINLSWEPANDELGRHSFAEHLAKGLLSMRVLEGYVVAVFGHWGSGKSTLLNFVQHFLIKAPKTNRPIIVEFNPWWFSGRDDLTKLFFGQLLRGISKWQAGEAAVDGEEVCCLRRDSYRIFREQRRVNQFLSGYAPATKLMWLTRKVNWLRYCGIKRSR